MTFRTPENAPGMSPGRALLILAGLIVHEWLALYGLYALIFKT